MGGQPRTVTPAAPYDTDNTAEFTGATTLGCSMIVSHESGTGNSVLTRFHHDTGRLEAELLEFGDGELLDRPGATGYLQGIPTTFLDGTIPTPYPASKIGRNYVATIGEIPWLVDTGILGISPTIPNLSRLGHGGDLTLIRTCIVEDEKEFVIDSRFKALHRHKLYAQVGTQTDPTQPSSLSFNETTLEYDWPVHTIPQVQRDFFQGSFTSPTREATLVLDVQMWPVHPIVTGTSPTKTANFRADNGPGQERGYGLFLIDDSTAPDYGGSASGGGDVPGLRDGVYLYAQITRNGPNPATFLANAIEPVFSSIVIPGPQSDGHGDTQYDQVASIPGRNVGQWSFSLTHGMSDIFPVPDPLVVGPFNFTASTNDGSMFEAILRIIYVDIAIP